MEENILTTIKKLLGIEESYTAFDTDILVHINSVVSVLTQLGVGEKSGFVVTAETTWSDYIGSDARLDMVKTLIYLRVRLLFDPPTSSAVIDSMKNVVNELEFRMNVASEEILQ